MKQITKKSVVVLFSLLIVFSMMFLPIVNINMSETGSSAADVFVIDSVEKWNEFCKRVNQGQSNLNAELNCNLKIEDKSPPITVKYNGHFYSNKYHINLNDYEADLPYYIEFVNYCGFIFDEIGEKADIVDLIVRCTANSEDKDKVKSGICKENKGTIKDCTCDFDQQVVSVDNNCGICKINNGTLKGCSFSVGFKYDDSGSGRNRWAQDVPTGEGMQNNTSSTDVSGITKSSNQTNVSSQDASDKTKSSNQTTVSSADASDSTKSSDETSDVIKPYVLILLSVLVVLSLGGFWILYRKKTK